jgi:hypothetical protein
VGNPLRNKMKCLCNVRCSAGNNSALYPAYSLTYSVVLIIINSLNAELNPICHLLALLGAHHILHVSWVRVNVASRCCSVGAVNRVGAKKLRNRKNFPPKHADCFWAHRASYSMCTVGHVNGIKRQEPEAENLPPYVAEVKTE